MNNCHRYGCILPQGGGPCKFLRDLMGCGCGKCRILLKISPRPIAKQCVVCGQLSKKKNAATPFCLCEGCVNSCMSPYFRVFLAMLEEERKKYAKEHKLCEDVNTSFCSKGNHLCDCGVCLLCTADICDCHASNQFSRKIVGSPCELCRKICFCGKCDLCTKGRCRSHLYEFI